MKVLNAAWFKIPKPGNLGDIMTPYILRKYGFTVYWIPINNLEHADTLCVGSIAPYAKSGMNVLGSGIMSSNNKLNKNAIWRWVRGPETRKRVIECGGTCPEIYGDPALLLPRLYNPYYTKKYTTGILPHYVDYKDIKKQYPNDFVINILNENIEIVIDQILSCEKIITSSLHGIITAHAYGIPVARFEHNKLVGDGVKFLDHSKAIDCEVPLSTIKNPTYTIPPKINTHNIHRVLTDLLKEK